MALVGDSHASALFPGVNVMAQAHGWKLVPYLKIDCSFLDYNDLVYYGPPTVPYPECMTWNKTRPGEAQQDAAGLDPRLDEPLDLHRQQCRGNGHGGNERARPDDQQAPAFEPGGDHPGPAAPDGVQDPGLPRHVSQ